VLAASLDHDELASSRYNGRSRAASGQSERLPPPRPHATLSRVLVLTVIGSSDSSPSSTSATPTARRITPDG
jgi:hypothetical protein